jgi:hypothetical protein
LKIASVPMPGRPRWAAFDAKQHAFFIINIADPPGLVVIDAGHPAEIANVFEIPAAGPHGLDLDVEAHRLFCGCDAKRLICLDARSGKMSRDLALSGEPDVIFFNAKLGRLDVAMGDSGLIDVVDTEAMRLIETIKTEAGRTRSGSMRGEIRFMHFLLRRIGLLSTGIKANHVQRTKASVHSSSARVVRSKPWCHRLDRSRESKQSGLENSESQKECVGRESNRMKGVFHGSETAEVYLGCCRWTIRRGFSSVR